MSHTEVLTEDHRRREFENRINVAVRHCRIGRVTKKQKADSKSKWMRGVLDRLWQPDENDQPLRQTFPGVFALPSMHPSCAGCIGKVCGNVACPSRPVVTCAA